MVYRVHGDIPAKLELLRLRKDTLRSRKDIESFITEVKEVCSKHNLVLRGTCFSEGQFGEILIVDPEDIHDCGWKGEALIPKEELTDSLDYPAWYIDGVKGTQ